MMRSITLDTDGGPIALPLPLNRFDGPTNPRPPVPLSLLSSVQGAPGFRGAGRDKQQQEAAHAAGAGARGEVLG